jgi:hypothetical protein
VAPEVAASQGQEEEGDQRHRGEQCDDDPHRPAISSKVAFIALRSRPSASLAQSEAGARGAGARGVALRDERGTFERKARGPRRRPMARQIDWYYTRKG